MQLSTYFLSENVISNKVFPLISPSWEDVINIIPSGTHFKNAERSGLVTVLYHAKILKLHAKDQVYRKGMVHLLVSSCSEESSLMSESDGRKGELV